MSTNYMFSWRNKENIRTFPLKKVSYLGLRLDIPVDIL